MTRKLITSYNPSRPNHSNLTDVIGQNYDLYSSEFTPESGTRSKWTKNFHDHSTYPWYEKGSIYGDSGTSSELHIIGNGASGNSNCLGNKKEVTLLIGGGTSNYLSTQITGLSFNWRCGGKGGNALGFWKWGYWLQLPGSSSKYRWGSADMEKEKLTDQFEDHNFPSDVINKLNQGYVFRYLMFNISSYRNGTKPSCATSRVFINSFKFKYKQCTYPNSFYAKLILPKARPWSRAGDHKMI